MSIVTMPATGALRPREERVRAVAQRASVAVGVAYRQRGDSRLALRAERGIVAHAFAGTQRSKLDDARPHRDHRLGCTTGAAPTPTP